jgi:hypothetical protein
MAINTTTVERSGKTGRGVRETWNMKRVSPHGMTVAQAALQWAWPDTNPTLRTIYLGYSPRENARAYVDVMANRNGTYRLFCYGGRPVRDVPGHTIVCVMEER